MSTYNPDDPETWSIPTNYDRSSCFIDSVLWAILYKINNPFYQYISDANLNSNDADSKLLSDLFLAFYGGIHSNNYDRKELENIIMVIRYILNQKSADQFITGKQHDAGDFFRYIKTIFDNSSISANAIDVNITTTLSKQDDAKLSPPKNDTPVKRHEKHNILCVNPISVDIFDTVKININSSGETLTIEYPPDNFEGKPQPIMKKVLDTHGNEIMVDVTDSNGKTEKVPKKEPSGISTISEQITYEYTSKNSIDYLMIPVNRTLFDKSTGVSSKNSNSITILDKIGDLYIHSIVYHDGTSSSGGHYTCYFKMANNWYLFDDGAKKVENTNAKTLPELLSLQSDISQNCAFLFYTTNAIVSSPLINQDDYQKYYDVVQKYIIDNISLQSRIAAVSSSSNSTQVPTSKNTIQNPDICEKYGQEWLDLFIDANAVPNTSFSVSKGSNQGPSGTKQGSNINLTYKNKTNGSDTTVVVPELCLAQPQGQNPGQSSVTSQRITTDDLKDYLTKTDSNDGEIEPKFTGVINALTNISKNSKGIDFFKDSIPKYINISIDVIQRETNLINESTTNESDKKTANERIQKELIGIDVLQKLLNILATLKSDNSNANDILSQVGVLQKSFDDDQTVELLIESAALSNPDVFGALKTGQQLQVAIPVISQPPQIPQVANSPPGTPTGTPVAKAQPGTPTGAPVANLQQDPLIGKFYVNNDQTNPRIIKITSQNLQKTKEQLANKSITIYDNELEADVELKEKEKRIREDAETKAAALKLAAEAKEKAVKLAADEAQQKATNALVEAQQLLKNDNKKIPSVLLDLLDTKKTVDSDKIFTKQKIPTFKSLNNHDIVYNNTNNTLYMKVSATVQGPNLKSGSPGKDVVSDKFLNLTDGLLYDSSLELAKVNAKSYSGGTRTRKIRNTNGGKRTRKGKGKRHLRKTKKLRNGKRTRKLIRDKNKLRTNKLKTNKLKTRKLKLNKRRTRKA